MKKSPLISIAIRNGVLAGMLTVISIIVMYYLGRHPIMVAPFLDLRILLFGIFIYFSLREFRETHQGGILHFSQGMAGSFMMIMIAATTTSILLWGFTAIEPDFIGDYIPLRIEYLKTYPPEEIVRIGKEAYERNLESVPATNGKQIASAYFIQSMIIGFFVSIILSVILRKQAKP